MRNEMKVPLLKGDRVDSDVEYRSSLLVNAHAVLHQVFGVPGFIRSHPGYDFYTETAGTDRGGVYNERLQQHLRISGDKLVRVDPNGTVYEVEGLILGEDSPYVQASLPYSFNTQAIITGFRMYLYDGTELNPVTDTDLGNPIDGCWINGYYFLTDGEYLYHTDIADEYAIDPLKYATSEFSPDPTKGVAKTQDNQVMVFNRYTTEFFYDVANEFFAFTRSEGKAVKAGIIGTHTKIEMAGQFFCMGSAKDEAATFIIISGGSAQNFSTREIDTLLEEYAERELERAIMTTRTADREQLIYIQLPEHTLLYNHTVAQSDGLEFAWSILKQGVDNIPWGVTNTIYDPRLNLWIGGDRFKDQLNVLNMDNSAQDGEPAEIILTTPFLQLEYNSVDEIEIETIPGQQVPEVKAFLSTTYDGISYGKEWALTYSEGKGDYGRRFIFRRLGYCRDWMGFRLRLVTTGKVAFANLVVTYG